MQPSRNLLILVFAPPMLAGLIDVTYSAIQALVLGRCDPKFGCAGSVQVAAFLCGVALLPSWLGFIVSVLPHRVALKQMPHRSLVLLVVVLGAFHAAMFHTFHAWPLGSMSAIVLVWAVLAAATSWAAISGFRRWAPNNSFKPKPLRSGKGMT